MIVISARAEEEIAELDDEDKAEFLEALGIEESGLDQLIRAAYDLLGLATYFTAGEQEVRAWTFRKGIKAPQAAGIIHTDFERGFIRAETVSFEDLDKYGNMHAAKEAGRVRLEGKECAANNTPQAYCDKLDQALSQATVTMVSPEKPTG